MSPPRSPKLFRDLHSRALRGETPCIASGQTAASSRLDGETLRPALLRNGADFIVSYATAYDLVALFQALNREKGVLKTFDAAGVSYEISYREASLEEQARRSGRPGPLSLSCFQSGPNDPAPGAWIKHVSLKIGVTRSGRTTTLYYSLHPDKASDAFTGNDRLVFYLEARCDPFRLHGGPSGRVRPSARRHGRCPPVLDRLLHGGVLVLGDPWRLAGGPAVRE